jgi:hypothetical protein
MPGIVCYKNNRKLSILEINKFVYTWSRRDDVVEHVDIILSHA